MSRPYPEFIPGAGASLATRSVLEGESRIRWVHRKPSRQPADNGWRILGDTDTGDYLPNPKNWRPVDLNELCAIEPALIGSYDFPVGADLQIVREGRGVLIVDTKSGREAPRSAPYVPPQHRAGQEG
ncbi:DUF2185 domain-containing protein [Streptomyces sp. NBC_00572]|uniref:immunity protein Imm33 domain-containing protein n=1 Tax=Streptomyces sp. NBC_00572 TaxID=2903664 RepID=UPI00224C9B41|nr:DUF2185 domain-containing protein [Streptomyces sp. NBC_00572]MCX4986067.1 DUF2185 domain-containing protein [Streptomyces sp. NBC_00572]